MPWRRRTRRDGLALPVAALLVLRGADLTDLAVAPPRGADRIDMRHRRIARMPGMERAGRDGVMAPSTVEAARAEGRRGTGPTPFQCEAFRRHRAPMLASRQGGRALPLARGVEITEGANGPGERQTPLDAVAPRMGAASGGRLMGDRFHGTADRIAPCPG